MTPVSDQGPRQRDPAPARPSTHRQRRRLPARSPGCRRRCHAALRHEWTGTALGAVANITLFHPDRGEARSIIRACLAEIDRLEGEFSLFRPDSALCRLNRDGVLPDPSLDMRRLLTEAVRFGDLSGGRFDVTVQPLWRLLAAHQAARTGTAACGTSGRAGAGRLSPDRHRFPAHPARPTGHGGDAERHRPGIRDRPGGRAAARQRHRTRPAGSRRIEGFGLQAGWPALAHRGARSRPARIICCGNSMSSTGLSPHRPEPPDPTSSIHERGRGVRSIPASPW